MIRIIKEQKIIKGIEVITKHGDCTVFYKHNGDIKGWRKVGDNYTLCNPDNGWDADYEDMVREIFDETNISVSSVNLIFE